MVETQPRLGVDRVQPPPPHLLHVRLTRLLHAVALILSHFLVDEIGNRNLWVALLRLRHDPVAQREQIVHSSAVKNWRGGGLFSRLSITRRVASFQDGVSRLASIM